MTKKQNRGEWHHGFCILHFIKIILRFDEPSQRLELRG